MKNQTVALTPTLEDAQLILACIGCAMVQTASNLHAGTKEQTLAAMDSMAALQAVESKLIKALNGAVA